MCKVCGGIFGDVIKDDMCSHCISEELYTKNSEAVENAATFNDEASEWPEDQEDDK